MGFKFTRVDLVLLLMVAFWGGNLTVIKVALKHFDPVVFNCLRFVIACLCMLVIYRTIFRDPIPRKTLYQLMLLGFVGNTLYQFMFIYGVNLTRVSHTAILLAVAPLFTAIISRQMGFEKIGKQIWFGIATCFAGIVLIVFGGTGENAFTLDTNLGDLLIILASLSWAIYTSFSRNVVDQYSHRHYLAYTVIFGTLFLIPLSLPAFFHQNWTSVQISDWVAVVYSALFSLVFGYSAWYYAVGKIGSTRTAVYSNLTPVSGLLVGMIFLGDRFSPLQWLGSIFILAGLVINRMA